MARNLELKARCPDLITARNTAVDLTGKNPEELKQTDIYYEVPVGRLKLRKFGNGTAELIWYDRAENSGHRVSRYEKRMMGDIEKCNLVLESNLMRKVIIHKIREVFTWNNCRIHLDRVESLGDFIEFEVILSDESDSGESRMTILRDLFKIAENDLISGSYSDLV
jgi:predicted adenylyl cyclase CyaB